MKKGFTLVELLAIIVIISVLSLITIPIISSQISISKINSYRTSVQNIIDEAKEYVTSNTTNNDIPQKGINIKKLHLNDNNIKSGLIKKMN